MRKVAVWRAAGRGRGAAWPGGHGRRRRKNHRHHRATRALLKHRSRGMRRCSHLQRNAGQHGQKDALARVTARDGPPTQAFETLRSQAALTRHRAGHVAIEGRRLPCLDGPSQVPDLTGSRVGARKHGLVLVSARGCSCLRRSDPLPTPST